MTNSWTDIKNTDLVLVMGGWKGLKGVLPAAIVAGVSFASMQLFVSNKIGPQLVDIMAALTAIIAMVVLLKVWHPKDKFVLAGEHEAVLQVQQHGFGTRDGRPDRPEDPSVRRFSSWPWRPWSRCG